MNFVDSKPAEQFLKAFKQRTDKNTDHFKNGPMNESFNQFENMVKFEKKIDDCFTNKRIDISEKLCFNRKSVATTMRLFFDAEVADQESENLYIKLNIFGKLVLNDQTDLGHFEYFSKQKNTPAFVQNFVKNFTFCENVRDLQVNFDNKDIPTAVFTHAEKARKNHLTADQFNGFTIIRCVKKSQVSFPLRAFISMSFESTSQSFKFTAKLAKLIGFKYGSRRDILDFLFEYAKKHELLSMDHLRLDSSLTDLFDIDSEGKHMQTIPLLELSSRVKSLLESNEVFEFVYEIPLDATLKKYMEVFELKLSVPLETTPDIISFYVSKLIFGEEEKKKLFSEEHIDNLNPAIKNHEKIAQLQEQINKLFVGLKSLMSRRDILKRISEDSSDYLASFLHNYEKTQELLEKQTPVHLGKRNSMEENEFTELLNDKYEELLDKEIETFLKNKNIN